MNATTKKQKENFGTFWLFNSGFISDFLAEVWVFGKPAVEVFPSAFPEDWLSVKIVEKFKCTQAFVICFIPLRSVNSNRSLVPFSDVISSLSFLIKLYIEILSSHCRQSKPGMDIHHHKSAMEAWGFPMAMGMTSAMTSSLSFCSLFYRENFNGP